MKLFVAIVRGSLKPRLEGRSVASRAKRGAKSSGIVESRVNLVRQARHLMEQKSFFRSGRELRKILAGAGDRV